MKHLRLVLKSFVIFGSMALNTNCKDPAKTAQRENTPPPNFRVTNTTHSSGTPSSNTTLKPVCEASAIGFNTAELTPLLPTQVSHFCVLKTDIIMSWGKGTNKKIEDVSNHIDGAGEIYSHNYFATRYDTFKYIDNQGSGTEVEVALTTYDKPENAYALFTYRAISNSDPDPEAYTKANRRPLKPIDGGGAAALGAASALLWKGNYLVELTYSNSVQTEQQAIAAADALLPEFIKAFGTKLPGSVELPVDVKILPSVSDGLIPLGIDYIPAKFKRPEGKGDALKLPIAGGYATGFMHEGNHRYRILAMQREERDAARDAMSVFQKMSGALPLRDLGDEAVYFTFNVGEGSGQQKAEGVVARNNTLVLAIVDEEFVIGDISAKAPPPLLSKEEKIAKLKALLAKHLKKPTSPVSSISAIVAPKPH